MCPILWDPMDCSLPGSSVLGIFQARTLEWIAISSCNAGTWKMKVKMLSCVWLLATPWTAAFSEKNIYFCFTGYAKSFDCVDHNKLWKILKEMGIPSLWPASWEICMQVKNQQLELDMEQQTGSQLGKEYVKAVYCHSAYLTYMQSTSWETLGWWSTKWNQDFWEKYQ